MSLHTSVLASAFLTLLLLSLPSSVGAQTFDEAEIQKAVEGMRQSGMPESQIQNFLRSVEAGRDAVKIIESGESSFGITPEDAERMAMDRKRKEFEAEHGDKPNVVISIGSDQYTLKILHCQGDPEMYSIQAKGPPAEHRLEFNAIRSSIGSAGIGFRIGHHTSYDLPRTTMSHFDGRTLRFSGALNQSVEFQPTGKKVRAHIEASCR